MWTIEEAQTALQTLSETHLQEGKVDLGGLTEAVGDFFYENKIKRYKKDNDGDMLLVEYGRFDFGKGDHFQWSFTRQFYKPTKIQQLRLTLYYDPTTAALSSLESDNFWNDALSKEAWVEQVKTTTVFKALQQQSLLRYEIQLNRV